MANPSVIYYDMSDNSASFLVPLLLKPYTVWRVESNQTTRPLTSRWCSTIDNTLDLRDPYVFNEARRHHFDRQNSFPSPFLSTFSDKAHTIRWGGKLRCGGQKVLYEINTQDLALFYGAQADEYLVLGVIPLSEVRATYWRTEYDSLQAMRY